ncbi:MAG: AAA family ATPase [Chloroflexi bacterium]|nr:AAA family ATPase [Chloroflexota bacterium]
MQWMVHLNRLGEEQRHVLDCCLRLNSGRLWIQGFAGSGKTVLLVHAIREALTTNPNLSACVVVYTHALKDLVSTGLPDHLRRVPVMTYHSFMNKPRHYDLLVVDEVQDLEREVLESLSKYATRLIVAGDGDQSIYRRRVSPEEIDRILSPEKHKLQILYRLTQTLKQIVKTILPHSNIEAARVDRMVANVEIRLAHATDLAGEIAWVWREASRYSRQGDPSAILLPDRKLIRRFIDGVCHAEGKVPPAYTEKAPSKYSNSENDKIDYNLVNAHLKANGISLRYLGSNYGRLTESDEQPIVYLMTYHSAKGLDYDAVFLPHLNSDMEFWRENEDLSRRLFFVATTRSRRNLFMSYHAPEPHRYVKAMPQDLLKPMEIQIESAPSGTNSDIFIF